MSMIELAQAKARQEALMQLVTHKSEAVPPIKSAVEVTNRHPKKPSTFQPPVKPAFRKNVRARLASVDATTWVCLYVGLLCLIAYLV